MAFRGLCAGHVIMCYHPSLTHFWGNGYGKNYTPDDPTRPDPTRPEPKPGGGGIPKVYGHYCTLSLLSVTSSRKSPKSSFKNSCVWVRLCGCMGVCGLLWVWVWAGMVGPRRSSSEGWVGAKVAFRGTGEVQVKAGLGLRSHSGVHT